MYCVYPSTDERERGRERETDIPASRNAICPRGGLAGEKYREEMRERERDEKREKERKSEESARIRRCTCGGWKFFFAGHSRIKPPLLSVVWRAKSPGVGGAESERCQNFQQFFIPLSGLETKRERGGRSSTSVNSRDPHARVYARSRRAVE